MLFPYTYVPHTMEKMHEFIEYIFFEVWCKAPVLEYGGEIFKGLPELQQMLVDFWNHEELAGKSLKGGDFFLKGLNCIFNDFKQLKPKDIEQIKGWYVSNNDIEKCCSNDKTVHPIRYDQIKTEHPQLAKNLRSFFANLYSPSFLALKFVTNRIGELDDHYNKFVKENNKCICPFCGIMPLDSEWDPTRDAYDHYLPKSKYPFNSINFKNLVPACDKCNSKNKGAKDPIFDGGKRRKAFFPFETESYEIELHLEFKGKDWTDMTPHDLTLTAGPKSLKEKIDTWLDVYSIEKRYKARCCVDRESWFVEMLDEWTNDGKTPEEYLTTLARQARLDPFREAKFLKKSFLEACRRAGLFTCKSRKETGGKANDHQRNRRTNNERQTLLAENKSA